MNKQSEDVKYRGQDSRKMMNMCLNCKRKTCSMGTCSDIDKEARAQRAAALNAKQYTMDGESHPISFWAQMYGVSPNALRMRLIKFDGDLKKALEHEPKPPQGKQYTCFGYTYTIGEWATLCGVSEAGLRYRLARGKPLEAVFFEAKERLKEGKRHV